MSDPNEVPLPGPPAPRKATGLLPGGPGAFHAQGRALVDARRSHLARVGMAPEHARALAPPDLDPRVAPPPLPPEAVPTQTPPPGYEPRKLPRLPGVNVPVEG